MQFKTPPQHSLSQEPPNILFMEYSEPYSALHQINQPITNKIGKLRTFSRTRSTKLLHQTTSPTLCEPHWFRIRQIVFLDVTCSWYGRTNEDGRCKRGCRFRSCQGGSWWWRGRSLFFWCCWGGRIVRFSGEWEASPHLACWYEVQRVMVDKSNQDKEKSWLLCLCLRIVWGIGGNRGGTTLLPLYMLVAGSERRKSKSKNYKHLLVACSLGASKLTCMTSLTLLECYQNQKQSGYKRTAPNCPWICVFWHVSLDLSEDRTANNH